MNSTPHMIHMILHHTTHHTWYMIHIIPHIAKKLIFTGVNKTWSGVSEARKKNSDHCGLEFLSYNEKFCDLWKSMGKKLILVLHYASVSLLVLFGPYLYLYFLYFWIWVFWCIFAHLPMHQYHTFLTATSIYRPTNSIPLDLSFYFWSLFDKGHKKNIAASLQLEN